MSIRGSACRRRLRDRSSRARRCRTPPCARWCGRSRRAASPYRRLQRHPASSSTGRRVASSVRSHFGDELVDPRRAAARARACVGSTLRSAAQPQPNRRQPRLVCDASSVQSSARFSSSASVGVDCGSGPRPRWPRRPRPPAPVGSGAASTAADAAARAGREAPGCRSSRSMRSTSSSQRSKAGSAVIAAQLGERVLARFERCVGQQRQACRPQTVRAGRRPSDSSLHRVRRRAAAAG